MAKIRKNAQTPEEREAYLRECDIAVADFEHCATAVVTCGLYDLPYYEIAGRQLTDRETYGGIALDIIQSPKDNEDFSQKHLARWRECFRRLGDFRYECLRKNPSIRIRPGV